MAPRSLRARATSTGVGLLCLAGLVQCGAPKNAFTDQASFVATGTVCGSSAIAGMALPRVHGDLSGCGIARPVEVSSVSGVELRPAAVLDCRAAKVLNKWVRNSAAPAFRDTGGGLDGLRVAASYTCRTRNNQPGAKLSEHAQGQAIDISAFDLRDGSSVSVERGWQGSGRKPLAAAHKSACKMFGTVLGPESDRFHRDHFHLDTQRHYGGAYCR